MTIHIPVTITEDEIPFFAELKGRGNLGVANLPAGTFTQGTLTFEGFRGRINLQTGDYDGNFVLQMVPNPLPDTWPLESFDFLTRPAPQPSEFQTSESFEAEQ